MKESDLPDEAIKRLKELEQNPAWLAMHAGISRALVYAYLRKKKGLSWTNLERLFGAMGQDLSILITPKKNQKPRKPPTPPEMPV